MGQGNLAISEKRANSVVDWLTAGGYVQPDHIVAMGAGDRYPLFDTPNEFRGNRRVEIRIICPVKKL
jgi:outer membrane protein OmpA-like peptidoglycan-associated protein